MRTMNRFAITVAILCFFNHSVMAKTLWSDFSLTLLSGENYQVGDNKRKVLTAEYATGTSWGSAFMFFDRLHSSNGHNETYGELTARIKLSDWHTSWAKNIYFVPSVEMAASGGNNSTNYLLGLGTDLIVSGFDYIQVNALMRNNDSGDNSWQATVVWSLPLGPLQYDGFIDYASHVDNIVIGVNGKTHFNMTSQLKYDLAPQLNLDTKLYVGVEYVYWNNKFGIDGVNERNVNLIVKYHF